MLIRLWSCGREFGSVDMAAFTTHGLVCRPKENCSSKHTLRVRMLFLVVHVHLVFVAACVLDVRELLPNIASSLAQPPRRSQSTAVQRDHLLMMMMNYSCEPPPC